MAARSGWKDAVAFFFDSVGLGESTERLGTRLRGFMI
jgi:hypothetical protein